MDRLPALEHLRMLLAVGEEAEAARFVQELHRTDTDAGALLVPVAATLLEREHCQLALELAVEAIAADHHCGAAHQVRVDALAELGDIDAARTAAEEWADVDPGCPDAFVALSWARLADYDDAGAADAAAHARDLDPDAPGGWLALAYVCRLAQEWDTLVLYCAQALDRDPTNVDAQLFLGEALVAQGHANDGITVLRGIDDPRARSALRHLRARQAAVSAALVVVVVLFVVGVATGSMGVVIGAGVGMAVFGRRNAPGWIHNLAHPMVVWSLVAMVGATVLRTLL
ncbi:MAG: tetratricopeptide repeat protein [Acidimicrobiales bacterium]